MAAPGASTGAIDYAIVIPTIGRSCLSDLLMALACSEGPAPSDVVLVDDRSQPHPPLPTDGINLPVRVEVSGGRGPAAARNLGWRSTSPGWVVFLDDDVVPGHHWRAELAADLAVPGWTVAGSQGRLRVPLPAGRRPTDWERNTAALMTARWATADMAYRRDVLEEVGGFDERFPRAFREDADLGLRVTAAGYVILQGERRAEHPVRAASRWVSLSKQAGNADDVLMAARHGPGWRAAAGAGPGRNQRHLLTTAAAITAAIGLMAGRRRLAAAAGTAWLTGTVELAAARIAAGPPQPGEIATMVVTSAAIPPLAVGHRLAGWRRLPQLMGDTERSPLGEPRSPLALQPAPVLSPCRVRPRARPVDPAWQPAAILFDRDGTLVMNRPHSTNPALVTLMPGARNAVREARRAGLAVAVVSNQSAIGRGHMTCAQVEAVNRRVDQLAGPFDVWRYCPHAPFDGCDCRKPAPGLIKAAAAALGIDAKGCAVIGDIGSDVEAARAAGARGVLVPTRATRKSEIAAAPVVAPDIIRAVELVLAGMC